MCRLLMWDWSVLYDDTRVLIIKLTPQSPHLSQRTPTRFPSGVASCLYLYKSLNSFYKDSFGGFNTIKCAIMFVSLPTLKKVKQILGCTSRYTFHVTVDLSIQWKSKTRKWIKHTGSMRNQLCCLLFSHAGDDATRTRWFHLFLKPLFWLISDIREWFSIFEIPCCFLSLMQSYLI